jgi:hypothetical protein
MECSIASSLHDAREGREGILPHRCMMHDAREGGLVMECCIASDMIFVNA